MRVRQVLPGQKPRALEGDRYEVDFGEPSQLAEIHRLVRGAGEDVVGGIISFLGIGGDFLAPDLKDAQAPLRACQWTFNAVKEFEPDLRASAVEGGGWFVNLTALGGKFGLEDAPGASLVAAGTLGIAKTLARECPRLAVKAIDVDPSLDPHLLAGSILAELSADDATIEVGLARDGRFRLELTSDDAPLEIAPPAIDRDWVILITGGAYGVTAEIAKSLAGRGGPTLVLVGRSPLPAPETTETQGLRGVDLKKRLIELARGRGEKVLPADIERARQRIEKDRTIRETIDECQAAGARVEYHALDVRDAEAFGRLIDDLYARHGRIDGVVHGAGIIDDKRIRDKSPESFVNVFTTKAIGAMVLASRLRPESLRFMVFFSSVSGRFGNAGQADYSAANEFLNKLACRLDRAWPGRVVAINWGPWDGGMVSDELRRMYDQVGFSLIPIDEGVRAFEREIASSGRGEPEVLISCSVERMLAGTTVA